jgi:tRNA1Val (adenine37-N6)-methyltransferase
MRLEDIMISAKYILKNKGFLYIVHRCDRLEEIFQYLVKYNFSVKKLQFIYTNHDKEAIMVLIKATKNGLEGIKVNPPINVMKHKTYKNIFG